MSVFVINIVDANENGAFKFSTTLEGSDFQFVFRYNSRDEHWYFDLYDVQGNIIRSGIKCIINYPLIRLIRSEDRPLGELLVINTQLNAGDPGLDSLSVEATLTYIDSDQIE